MRILHLNKFAYRRGGAEVYMLETARRQAARGHAVAIAGGLLDGRLADVDRENVEFFQLKIPDYSRLTSTQMPGAAAGVLWSERSRKAIKRIVEEFNPDLVHVHNYAHQLSSSVMWELNRVGVAVIYTAHDYKLICPAYTASDDVGDCFDCRYSVSSKLLRNRCLHGSLTWSATVAAEASLTRRAGILPNVVVAPSQFMAESLRNSWVGAQCEIHVVRNPTDTHEADWRGGGDYLLYVGRLSEEKGVEQLADAANKIGQHLVVAGDGPEREKLEAKNLPYVEYVGQVDSDRLHHLRRDCTAQVVPSIWPENAPLAALEAAGQGVPLIVTPRGGLVELSDLGVAVSFLDAPTADALRTAVDTLRKSDERPNVELDPKLNWTTHLDLLEEVYSTARSGARV